MTSLLYRFSLKLYHLSIRLAALRNPKARKWVRGRRHVFKTLRQHAQDLEGCVWFHCASLGEFEQGRPIIEALVAERPAVPVLVTFFSPSGYDVRKNFAGATLVTYLPASSSLNARCFLRIVKPRVAVFIKYEFWYHYLVALRRSGIPLIVASANFRTDHWLFSRYAGFIARELTKATAIYAQNAESWKRLSEAGFENARLAADTRFDRVLATVTAGEEDDHVRHFTGTHFTLIAGSTWPDDEKLLVKLAEALPAIKMVIAPHEVRPDNLVRLRRLFGEASALYSEGVDGSYDARILIIDNVGILAKIYHHGQVAYIGGGFSGRLHNILEPAAFGLPVIFGPKFDRFPEAVEMIGIGAGYTVKTADDLKRIVERFVRDPKALQACAEEARQFVISNVGGTSPVVEEITAVLDRA